MYHFLKVLSVTIKSLHERLSHKRASNRGEERRMLQTQLWCMHYVSLISSCHDHLQKNDLPLLIK